jgi:HKD family nuclease
VIPRRHVGTWFDASVEEQRELMAGVAAVREALDAELHPDGYNVGFNVGAAAGQTVFHLHVHVIPRYAGDVGDPRGGVRHVVPGKGNYLPTLWRGAPHGGLLVRGEDDALLPHLRAHIDCAREVDIAVAFILQSGVDALEESLRDLLERGGRLRILTGDYLDVTDPDALVRLLDLALDPKARLELRVFDGQALSFHPKAYLFRAADGTGVAYVGSSNLSATALKTGVEWNMRVLSSREGAGFAELLKAYERLFVHEYTQPLDPAWVEAYRARRRLDKLVASEMRAVEDEPVREPVEPHEIQREALAALESTRAEGYLAGLVVLATGLGKTWLAAFDSRDFRRVLFVAHREEILAQAMQTFRRVRPDARLGWFTGAEKDVDAEVVFASVQALSRPEALPRFARDAFDYIVIDEFHHASARTYRKLIDGFDARFLLGLTATPERTDGGDLLGLCQDNLVYRCLADPHLLDK